MFIEPIDHNFQFAYTNFIMHRRPSGFTIVELLVVIVVIGVLASISLVAYTGVSRKATEAAVVTDLTNTTKQFKLFQIENSGFPTTIDCTQPNSVTNKCIKPSGSNTIGVYYADNSSMPQTFCFTVINGNIKKNINQDGLMSAGACTYPFNGTLTATTASRSQINLSWTSITNASSYTVQKADNTSFTGATDIYTGLNTSTNSTGLTSSTTYHYRVKVTIAGDDSNWATTSAVTSDFVGPTGLASIAKTSTSINLSWNAVSGATGYKLQRSTSSSFSPNTEVPLASGTTTYNTTGLTTGVNYYFRVNVTDSGGTSLWSNNLVSSINTQTYLWNSPYTFAWTVPADVTVVRIEAYGGAGGAGGNNPFWSLVGGTGGLGGKVSGNLTVSAGQQLDVVIGGNGSNGTNSTWVGGSATSGTSGGTTTIKRSSILLVSATGGGGGGPPYYYCTDEGEYGCNNGYNANGVPGTAGGGNYYSPVTSGSVTSGSQSGSGKAIIIY